MQVLLGASGLHGIGSLTGKKVGKKKIGVSGDGKTVILGARERLDVAVLPLAS